MMKRIGILLAGKILLLILLMNTHLNADYIKNAIVACPSIEEIKVVEPFIDKDSNKFLLPKNCLILTSNAEINLLQVVEERYIQILILDLDIKMFTLKNSINRL